MNYFMDALKNYAEFSGRVTRTQYWMFILFYFIFYIALAVIDAVLGTLFLAALFSLALLVPSIAITARRLHDIGRSGWWQLIYLIPLIGLIVMLVFLVTDSVADNDYGPNPKNIS